MLRVKIIVRAIILLVVFNNLCISAQVNNDSVVSSIILQLNKIWNQHHGNIKPDISFSDLADTAKPDPFSLRTANNLNYQINQLLVQQRQKQAKLYRNTPGLELFGSYTENFKSPFYEADDNLVFRRRFQAGLDWSIFDNGFYENRLRAKQMEYEVKALKETIAKAGKARNFNQIKSSIFYAFNKQKTELLNVRRELSEQHIPEAEKLFELKQMTKDNFLKVLHNKTDISAQLNVYKNYNDIIENSLKGDMQDMNLPLIDIDIAKVFTASSVPQTDSAWFYRIKKQELEYNKLRDLNLHAQVKYNYFDLYDQQVTNRHFLSVGLTFGLPLQLNGKTKKELLAIESDLLKVQGTNNANEINYLILNLCYEFRYKLKQYMNLLEKRSSFYELVRIERVKHEFNDLEFNPSTALLMLDDIYKIDLELIDLKQDMYRDLLEISDKLPNLDISKAIKPVELTEKIPAIKAVYVWSSALDTLGAEFVNEYCQLNNFNRIVISAKPEAAYMKKVNALIARTGADVELMIGRNKLLTDGNIRSYLDSVGKMVDLSKVKAIHLDIEPHALDEFKTNKELLFGRYKTLLSAASDYSRQHKILLSASIPLSYPDDVLKTIDSLCDNIYLMAYENTDEDFIFKKSAEERKISLKRLVIAQRTKDFPNKVALNEKLKALIEKLDIKNYAVHDLGGMVKMDEAMIQNTKLNKD